MVFDRAKSVRESEHGLLCARLKFTAFVGSASPHGTSVVVKELIVLPRVAPALI